MQTVLVTGANRGIGLEFTRQFLHRGCRVVATSRTPEGAPELNQLRRMVPDRLNILPLDISREDSIAALTPALSSLIDSINVLINNAGILVPGERFGHINSRNLIDSFAVNAAGAFLLTQALEKFLTRASSTKVINISSILGSIACTTEFHPEFYVPSYSISKTALNMVTRLLSIELSKKGVIVVSFHPGWVKTEMGGAQATETPQESVSGMLNVLDRISLAESGKFFNYKGEELPW